MNAEFSIVQRIITIENHRVFGAFLILNDEFFIQNAELA